MMGDYLRYSMYDKYFKEIGDCVGADSCSPGTGKDSSHHLLDWYYSWGGALESAEYPWAWRIGGSSAHQGYQNVMAAYALSEGDMAPESPTGAEDWATSLDRQLEFLQWLQSSDGGIAGGATNSWEGAYNEPPADVSTFYGMFYDEKPVWHDPPSNQWFGFQVWDIERVAEYYRLTDDERAGEILDKWVPWALENTTVGTDGDFQVPADMEWSGQPDTWDGTSTGNPDLSVSVVSHDQDVGIAAGLAKTLLHYADATGDEAALETGEDLIDALMANEDDLGVAVPEVREDYERFDDPYDARTVGCTCRRTSAARCPTATRSTPTPRSNPSVRSTSTTPTTPGSRNTSTAAKPPSSPTTVSGPRSMWPPPWRCTVNSSATARSRTQRSATGWASRMPTPHLRRRTRCILTGGVLCPALHEPEHGLDHASQEPTPTGRDRCRTGPA